MSLSFTGPGGSVEQRSIVYALLRDNVLHHLEHGKAEGRFEALHGAALALGGKRVTLNARRLRAELEAAQAALLGRPIADLAISLRTRAVIDNTWPPPGKQATALVSESLGTVPWLDPPPEGLDQAFGHLVRALLAITEGSGENDVVEVLDL